MNKDLEKEYLADLDHYDESMGIHSTSYQKCKERLIRLAKIDSAEPSEALECSLKLYKMVESAGNGNGFSLNEAWKYHKTIKQALLKAQEPKQYLKWEDFIFKHTPKTIDVKMGENKYTLVVGFNVIGCELVILRNKKQQYFFLEADKQFFNDLHLERVEE